VRLRGGVGCSAYAEDVIASLRGTVLRVAGSSAVIDVAGVGYLVQITPALALTLRVGTEASFLTSLIVRDDSMTLFGFAEPAELDVFEVLIGVSGVGPKSALGVLATLRPDEIAAAVATEDDAPFRKVSGIGPKTAKLIVVSLAGRLVAIKPAATVAPVVVRSVRDDVVAALVGLGWNERRASEALDELLAELPESEHTVPALLRAALGRLGPAGSRAS
jgi:holliday junction DNA helicase RuvA